MLPKFTRKNNLKISILILIVIFILTIIIRQILTDPCNQANKSQSSSMFNSLMTSFDIFCSVRPINLIHQAYSLDSNVETPLISNQSTSTDRLIVKGKGLINQLINSLNLSTALLKNRFLEFKNSLEKLQANKNEEFKFFHNQDNLRFINGLVLGEKSTEAGYLSAFETAGLQHVLVASGFNVALIANLAWSFVKKLSKNIQLTGVLLAIWSYTTYLDFQPPLLRAAWMFTLIFWLKFLGIRTKRVGVLVFSVIVILLFRRDLLTSLSLWLSVLATLGIIVFSRKISMFWSEEAKGPGGFLLEEAGTSVAAQILIFPLLIWFFHSVNLVSLISNPLLLPWLGGLTQAAGLEWFLIFITRWWPGQVLLAWISSVLDQLISLYLSAVAWWKPWFFLNFSPTRQEAMVILAVWAGILSALVLFTRIKQERKPIFFHEKV